MAWWTLIAGGALAAYLWSGRRSRSEPPTGRWVWPVLSWQGRPPVVSSGFNSPRPGLPRHGGVDIMFARHSGDAFAPGTPNGSPHHVMPDGVVVVAASDGVVWSAMPTPRGHAVVIDHGPRRAATFYAHLEKLLVTPATPGHGGQRVRAGEPIGIVGFSPLDSERLKHLHFELWLGGPSDRVDPEAIMKSWEVLAEPARRNAALVFRPVGRSGDAYPDWIRDLDGKSGVYVIREIRGDSTEIVYVGESHTDRLYDTLTRHFQQWRRYKGFWKGQYGEGHDPGLTYRRDRCEVAVRVTTPNEAIDEEMRLIRRLKPRDNLLGQVAEDEVPF